MGLTKDLDCIGSWDPFPFEFLMSKKKVLDVIYLRKEYSQFVKKFPNNSL